MLQWSEFPILKRAKCRKPLLSVVARWPQTKSWNSCLLELLHIKSSGEGWSLSTRYQNLPVGRYYEGFLEINKTKTLCSRSQLRSEWTASVSATCLQKDCSELVGIGCCRFSPGRGGLPIIAYAGGSARKKHYFQAPFISKVGNSQIEVNERVGKSVIFNKYFKGVLIEMFRKDAL